MQQEADVALDQLHHSVDVHHRLLKPAAQVGTHLCLKVKKLTGHIYFELHLQHDENMSYLKMAGCSYLWCLQTAVQALDIFVKF